MWCVKRGESMSIEKWLWFLSIATLTLMAQCAPPNIIFVLVDDMGWTDLGCYDSDYYETPHVDKLAAQGMRFTDAYAACTVCSPSRASIMTGQYPARLHITDWIDGHKYPFAKLRVPDWTMRLATNIPNLARMLKQGGYATASIGKWHLGPRECWPEKQGFDLNIGGCERGHQPSYFSPYKLPTLVDGPDGEFLTDRLTDEAIKFMEANRERAFFIYLSHYAVHTPIESKEAVREKYKAKRDKTKNHKNPGYAALVESVDDSLGRLMRRLEELKLADNTIVIFTSDNGGLIGCTSNAPLRAGKGSPYEGGVRVPLIVKWPGVTMPGAVSQEPVISTDFFPTLLAMADVQPPRDHIVDGLNLAPLLKGEHIRQRNALYWHYPHYHPGGATPYGAVRMGEYRLIEFYESGVVELYNLKSDLGEVNNLTQKEPERAASMLRELRQWRASVNAQMPTDNPEYDAPQANTRGRNLKQ